MLIKNYCVFLLLKNYSMYYIFCSQKLSCPIKVSSLIYRFSGSLLTPNVTDSTLGITFITQQTLLNNPVKSLYIHLLPLFNIHSPAYNKPSIFSALQLYYGMNESPEISVTAVTGKCKQTRNSLHTP
jgi:hypothetical protein